DHQIVAGLAEHLVIAGSAGERVVAVAAEQKVVAALAEEDVVAGLPEQHVVARAAGERVIAIAAEKVDGGHRTIGLVDRDRVVATLAEHLDKRGIRNGGGAADGVDGAVVNQNATCCIAAGHDSVTLDVAEDGENPGSGGET